MEAIKVGASIRLIIRNIDNYINNELKSLNISKGQFEYFIMIYKNEGINQKDLASLMNVGKASVTKAIKKLIDVGLVTRTVKEHDQRNFGLYISESGSTYTKFFEETAKKINSIMFGNFTEYELKALIHLLNKMSENSKEFMESYNEYD